MEKTELMKRYEAEKEKEDVMEKSEMMKRYEAETGSEAIDYLTEYPFDEYTRWLEAKAAAYDRLMSGGKKTMKELANLLGRVVVANSMGDFQLFAGEPKIDLHYGFWYLDEDDEDYDGFEYFIPPDLIDFTGNWRDSLTLPDGWEES